MINLKPCILSWARMMPISQLWKSHLGLTKAAVAIPPTKSPITTMQGAQAASLKLQGILKKKCGKVWSLADPHQYWSPSDEGNFTSNARLCEIVANIGNMNVGYGDHYSTTDLDSHANMAVVGSQCAIISRTGLHENVAAYSPDLPCKIIEIVNVAIAYYLPYTLETTLLFIQNYLHIPEMNHNSISNFIWDMWAFKLMKCPSYTPLNPHKNITAYIILIQNFASTSS